MMPEMNLPPGVAWVVVQDLRVQPISVYEEAPDDLRLLLEVLASLRRASPIVHGAALECHAIWDQPGQDRFLALTWGQRHTDERGLCVIAVRDPAFGRRFLPPEVIPSSSTWALIGMNPGLGFTGPQAAAWTTVMLRYAEAWLSYGAAGLDLLTPRPVRELHRIMLENQGRIAAAWSEGRVE